MPVKSTTRRTGPKTKLNEMHTKYLINYLEKNPLAVVGQIADALCEQFDGPNVSKTTIHKHIRGQCLFSPKVTDSQSGRLTLLSMPARVFWIPGMSW